MKRRMLFLAIASLAPVPLLAQASLATQSLPPGFVTGAKNPELIPDSASYRLILLHLASLNSADPQTVTRQSAVYSRIGLSAADTSALQQQVAAFKAAYSQWQTQAGSPPSAAAEQQAKTLATDYRDNILKSLTAEGAVKFSLFVNQEKAHMIVRP